MENEGRIQKKYVLNEIDCDDFHTEKIKKSDFLN